MGGENYVPLTNTDNDLAFMEKVTTPKLINTV